MKMKIVVIGSGKGGVGKSTISVSLALLFKNLGFKVGLIDADIYGPSLKGMLTPDIYPKEEAGQIIPASSKGIQIISAAYFSKFNKGAPVRAPLINGIIEQFISKVKWDNRDLIIIDLPPGTGDIHLTILQKLSITGAVAVTTPQKIAVLDVEKAIYLFQNMNVPLLGIIENMSFYQDPLTGEKHRLFGEGGGEEISKKFNIPLLGQVPIDPHLMESLDQGGGAKFSLSQEVLWKIAVEISSKLCDHDEDKKIVEVKKVDVHHAVIHCGDKKAQYRFSDLQDMCPCARCLEKDVPADLNVSVRNIELLGNYAIRFHFTSGCSQGLYTWQSFS